MPQSTLKTALLDRLHEQAQGRETRWIACQEAARCLRDQAAEVYTSYAFTRADALCRCTPSGVCTQAAMTLTGPGETVTVVCSLSADEQVWFIIDASRLTFPASVYIRAVQVRIEANKSSAGRNSASTRKAVN